MTGEKYKLIEIQKLINKVKDHGYGEIIIKITDGQITACDEKLKHKWGLKKEKKDTLNNVDIQRGDEVLFNSCVGGIKSKKKGTITDFATNKFSGITVFVVTTRYKNDQPVEWEDITEREIIKKL